MKTCSQSSILTLFPINLSLTCQHFDSLYGLIGDFCNGCCAIAIPPLDSINFHQNSKKALDLHLMALFDTNKIWLPKFYLKNSGWLLAAVFPILAYTLLIFQLYPMRHAFYP